MQRSAGTTTIAIMDSCTLWNKMFCEEHRGASITRAFNRKSMKKIARRQSIKMFGALGAGLASAPFLSEAAQTAGRSSRPNLIVYMSDDHGMLFSEAYGATNIHTPNLARFAAEGMKFTHAFNTSPS